MKKAILTTIASLLAAQIVHAGELYCGANIEQTPGSQVYNKLLFWEKADTSKATARFLLADGTLLKSDNITPEALAKIVDGTLVIGTSTLDGKVTIFSGRVKKDQTSQIKYVNLAMAASMDSGTPLLIANDVSIVCKEM